MVVTASTTRASTSCLNCGEPFEDRSPRPAARFCSMCGQEAQPKPPTLREFAQQFGGAYFSTEGALWRSLALLLFRPGQLTAQYLAGRRRHYVLPLRLYLTISLLVLLLVRLLGSAGPEIPANPVAEATALHNLQINIGPGKAGVRDGVFFCERLPGWMCKRLQKRIDIDPKAVKGEIEAFKDRLLGNLGAAMFVLLPSFALWLKLAYWNRGLRYTEHLVFALHVHAFWFLALALMLLNVGWLTLALVIGVPLYTLAAMKRVYGGRRWPRVLRALAIAGLYGLVMAFAAVGLALWSLLS